MQDLNAEPPLLGVVTAVVTSLEDPDELGRIGVWFPWLGEQTPEVWARVVAPTAGPGRGLFFMPELDDQVLVVFEEGDFTRPFILGALWNSVDASPAALKDGKNDVRLIKSRTGHTVQLDDTDKAQKVSVLSQGGHGLTLDDTDQKAKVLLASKAGHALTLDDSSGKEQLVIKSKSGHTITLDDASGGETITIQDKGGKHKIILESSGAVTISSGQDLKIEAKGSVVVCGGSMGAARQDDPTQSSAAEDPDFWTWVNMITTHTHPTTAPGSPTGPPVVPTKAPSACKGKIVKGSTKVKVG
jgi:uncharacterized protein involved in type VI secretion and phage assembly